VAQAERNAEALEIRWTGGELISEALWQDAMALLTRCLGSVETDGTTFFSLDTSDTRAVGDISRAAAQLIEITSWIGLLGVLRPRFSELAEFLQGQAATDPEQAYAHPSRLRSLIILQEFDNSSMEASIEHMLSSHDQYLADKTTNLLGYADLLGTLVHYHRTARLPSGFPSSQRLIDRAKATHERLLALQWEAMKSRRVKDSMEPRDIGYSMWLLFLDGYYRASTSRRKSLLTHLDYLERRTHEITTDMALAKYRRGRFSRIIYPHLMLYFVERKLGRAVSTHPNLLPWIAACSQHLLEELNGYHAGLLLKLVLAIDKNGFLDRYVNSGVAAMIAAQSESHRVSAGEEALLREALRASSAVELVDTHRLTGGWSKARVYRVVASFSDPLTPHEVGPEREFVVKIGPRIVLGRAEEVFAALPENARKLFAAHGSPAETGHVGAGEDSYSLSEWLTGYVELGKLVESLLPENTTQAAQTQRILDAIRAALDLIDWLHQIPPVAHKQQPGKVSLEIRLAALLERMSVLADKAPYLDVAMRSRLKYKAEGEEIEIPIGRHTVIQLLRYFTRIPLSTPRRFSPERDVVTHGDCHAYNIMVAKTDHAARFIDIGDIRVDDYLIDFAQLAAHLCASLHLEQYSEPDLDQLTDPFGRENRLGPIDFLYRERWDGIASMWNVIVDHVAGAVATREHPSGMRRFAFYLADRLLFIASKSSSPAKAAVLYIQSMAILSHLLESLRKDKDAENPTDVVIPPGRHLVIRF